MQAMSSPARAPRKFLVVIDKTPECKVAIRFATRRAMATGGRVTLLCVAQPADFQQWRGVEEIMRDEAHQEAEALIHDAAKTVNELSGIICELIIAEGRAMESLMELLKAIPIFPFWCLPPPRRKKALAPWSQPLRRRLIIPFPSPSFPAIFRMPRSTASHKDFHALSAHHGPREGPRCLARFLLQQARLEGSTPHRQ
jgi:hypothetical protein